jgi:kynurenine formamidase
MMGHDWVRLGAPARFGSANVLRGLGAVRTGDIISLNLELDDPDVPFGRPPFTRTARLLNDLRELPDGRFLVINDDQIELALQGSSQWDSFAHYGVIDDTEHSVYYGGFGLEETFRNATPEHLGIQALGPAIIARGVLIDLVGELGDGRTLPEGLRVDRAMVERTLAAQSVTVEPGDVVLLYTGFENVRADLGGGFPDGPVAGIDGSTIPLWQELDVLAIASDNPAVEALPTDHAVHIAMLRGQGVPLGELWALRDLAEACRADRRYDFLLSSVPLRIHGAFGSPVNAVAVR